MIQTHRLFPRALGILLLGTLWALSQPSPAQEEPTWYQVEVIIFERTGADSGIEGWPRNLQLRYPFNWVELRDPDNPNPQEPDSAARENTPYDTEAADKVDLKRQPYFYLPSGERKLNRHANSLGRQNDYRVLFHQAWRQPAVEQKQAPAILITGGDTFGSHYELEGSITLSVSRYLHLYTHLWLTEFEPNFGQPPGAWPELPRRPNLLVEERAQQTPSWGDPWNERSDFTWDESVNETSSLPDFLGEDFLPSRITTLTQQRRMRSRELHYIDHPLFGVLIEVTPYERPEEEQNNRRDLEQRTR